MGVKHDQCSYMESVTNVRTTGFTHIAHAILLCPTSATTSGDLKVGQKWPAVRVLRTHMKKSNLTARRIDLCEL